MLSIPWRTGVNMREFAYYGTPVMPHTSAALQTQQLQALKDLQVRLVRFFASQRDTPTAATIERLRTALDRLEQFGMQAIVCLDDGLGSGFTVPGTNAFHSQVGGHLHSDYWVNENYRSDYLPHVSAIVRALKDHPAALLWELGNEYALHPREPMRVHSQAFLRFAAIASETIKEIAPQHLVSTGLVNSRHVASLVEDDVNAFARQLYGLASIDVISIHYYQHDGEKNYSGIDLAAARDLQKPFYIGEVGMDKNSGGRDGYLKNEIAEWKNAGAFTVLPWAFDTSPMDVGVSDLYAFARIHGDFEGIKNVMKSHGVDAPKIVVPLPIAGPTPEPARREEREQPAQPFPTPSPTPTVQPQPETAFTPLGVAAPLPVPVPVVIPAAAAQPVTAPVLAPVPAFQMLQPARWPFVVRSKFDDPANYGGSWVQRREGMLIVPQPGAGTLHVQAAQRGVVQKVASYPPGYGSYLILTHRWYGETYATWYGHMATISVREGDYVNAGDVIGVAGRSGSASETCLFFTVQHIGKGRKNYVVEDVIDPAPLFASQLPPRDDVWWDADVTVSDGTVMQPGALFKKTWRVRNAGNTTWGAGYQLVFHSGQPMGSGASVPAPPARPGERVLISVDMVAPQTPGEHKSTWMLQNPQGLLFREDLYTLIRVPAAVGPTPQPVGQSRAAWDADVTIPDRMPIKPGTKFTKTWRIVNGGDTTWGPGYTLAFDRDERMGGPQSVPLPALRPRQKGEVSVDLVAPQTPGLHRSTWQPTDPAGAPFDFEMYAEILVDPKAGEAGALNNQTVFASPVSGSYTIGWRYLDPVPYLDGTHKGVDYVSRVGVGLPISAGGNGVVHMSHLCSVCTPSRPNFISHGLNQAQQNDAFNKLEPWTWGFGHLVIVRYDWNAIPARARELMTSLGCANWFAYVYYAHLHEIFVAQGAAVAAGTPLGTLGNSGNSTGPHLHLEIRIAKSGTSMHNYKRIDPLMMFLE